MKINRKSIWYALFMFPTEDMSLNCEHRNGKTLCSFFWRTVLNATWWFIIVAPFAGFAIASLVFMMVIHPIITITVVVFVCGALARSIYIEKHLYEEKPKKQPGVFKSMYRSVKGKFCPLITFED